MFDALKKSLLNALLPPEGKAAQPGASALPAVKMPPAGDQPITVTPRTPPKAPGRRRPAGPPPMTPERAEILREALAVHRAKRKMLDQLDDEERAKLIAMAITAFSGPGPGRGH